MSRPVPAARRYAEAAFEVALDENRLDQWRDDLDVAAAMLERSDVASVVHSPAIPLDERQAVVTALLAPRIGPGALRLVELLVARGRSQAVGRVAEEYTRRLNAHRGVVMVTVTSAVPLTASETAAVRTRAENLAGAAIDLRTVVDPDLLGGLTIQVRDQLTDASIRGRLERLRDQLHAGGRLR
jgi:F-type H+-transporting ATPase subunit delta